MITAIVIPYHLRSAACLVVVSDGPRVLAHETIEVGRLEERDGRVRRVITPDHIAEAIAHVRALMLAHECRSARVEQLEGDAVEAQRSRDIGAALLSWLPGAVAVAGERGELADRLRRLLPAEGAEHGEEARRDHAEPGGLRERASVQGACVGNGVGKLADRSREDADADAASHPARSPLATQGPLAHASVRRADGEGEQQPHGPLPLLSSGGQELPSPRRDPVLKLARRFAGIDPGSRHVAVTVLEGIAAPLRYVASRTWNIGRDVPLDKPKIVKRKGSDTTYTKTTRHEVTDEDVLQLLRELAAFLAEHEADEAAVETAKFAHGTAGALLLRSNAIGGEIRGWLRAAGLPVRSVTARGGWRAKVVALAGLGGSKEWPAAVRALVPDLPPILPAEDREHILDSAGCAAWAALPEPPEPEEKPARVPKAKRPRKDARKASAARVAAGCLGAPACRPPVPGVNGSRWAHGGECPAGLAAREKRGQKMKGNANARRSG